MSMVLVALSQEKLQPLAKDLAIESGSNVKQVAKILDITTNTRVVQIRQPYLSVDLKEDNMAQALLWANHILDTSPVPFAGPHIVLQEDTISDMVLSPSPGSWWIPASPCVWLM